MEEASEIFVMKPEEATRAQIRGALRIASDAARGEKWEIVEKVSEWVWKAAEKWADSSASR